MTGPFLLLVANERPLINVDVTLLINLGLWFALFLFLRATFWGPMLALITAREEGTEGSRAEATRLDAEAKELRAELATQREALRAEVKSVVPGLARDIAARVLRREVSL